MTKRNAKNCASQRRSHRAPIKKQITKCVTSSILQGKSILIKNMTYQEWQDRKAGEAATGYENDDAAALKLFGAAARDDSIVKRRTMKLENGLACFPDNDVLGECL